MYLWYAAGAFFNPNRMQFHWYKPQGVINAVRWRCSSAMKPWWYTFPWPRTVKWVLPLQLFKHEINKRPCLSFWKVWECSLDKAGHAVFGTDAAPLFYYMYLFDDIKSKNEIFLVMLPGALLLALTVHIPQPTEILPQSSHHTKVHYHLQPQVQFMFPQ